MLRSTLVALFLCAPLLAGCASSPKQRALPLDKLRLYETGVGYYERAGSLGGPGGASVPVPSGHLDDALKSMVVLGSDGQVQSVAFDSRNSPAVARARAGLPPEPDAPIRVHDVLLGLRGHEITVRRGPRRIRGRLVDVIGVPDVDQMGQIPNEENGVPTAAEQAGAVKDKTFALLVTRTGRYRRVDVAKIDEITPRDPDVRARMQAALDATVALRSNARGLIEVEGKGSDVRIGYLAESPIWRATYRIVLDDKDAAALQGWALVHNDTEEDWEGITLELVNGRPDSFLFPLAAPRYERRDLVVPDREVSSVPQLLDTTADAMWGDFLDTEEGLGLYGTGSGGGGSGSGYGYGSGSGRAGRVRLGSSIGGSDLVNVGNLAALATGEGRETKTDFVYGTGEPLTLTAGRSAMVPFVSSKVQSAGLTWFSGFGDGSARHAVMVSNITSQTLPMGTLSVFAEGGFSGETVLPRLKPDERRFLEIGDDLDTEMTVAERRITDVPQTLTYRQDRLEEHLVRTTTLTVEFRNRSGHPRHVHVEVGAGSNTTIEGADEVDFDSDRGHPLAIFEVAPAVKVDERKVVIVEGLKIATAFDGLQEKKIERLSTAPSLSDTERGAMVTVLARLEEQRTAQAEVSRLQAEIVVIEADIERLRGHLSAASQSEGDKNPLVVRLLETEDQLLARRKELETANEALELRVQTTKDGLAVLAPSKKAPKTKAKSP